MKRLLLLSLLLVSFTAISLAQDVEKCANNPSVQMGDIDPAPLMAKQGGVVSFSYFENLLDYKDFRGDPVILNICFSNIAPKEGVKSIIGTFKDHFKWFYDADKNCLKGTQSKVIPGGNGGLIKVEFKQVKVIPCHNNQSGFKVTIDPPACMEGVNETTDDTEYVYTCTIVSPPAILTSFTSKIKDCQGVLKWATVSEEDFCHFELEKSTDGMRYQTIDAELDRTQDEEGYTYNFTDPNLSKVNFYRLKSDDGQGGHYYSKKIILEKNCD